MHDRRCVCDGEWHCWRRPGESGQVKERKNEETDKKKAGGFFAKRRRRLALVLRGGTRWFFNYTPMTNLMAGIKSKQADSWEAVEVEDAAAFKSPQQ